MDFSNDISYQIKISKIDKKIPVVNGVHLHSMYNPIKEAEVLIEKYRLQLKERNNVLILGLGFGYHVYETFLRLKKYYGTEFNIIVIDPNKRVVEDCFNNIPLRYENIKVICTEKVEELYRNVGLVNFLRKKPCIIPHPASFSLYSDFFKRFMQYSAPDDLQSIIHLISDEDVANYLGKLDMNKSLDENLGLIATRTVIAEREDFLYIAYNELIKQISSIDS